MKLALSRRVAALVAAPVAIPVALAAAVGGLSLPSAAAADWTPPAFSHTIGHPGHAGLYAWGAATAPDGSILIGDYWNYVVRRYSTSGALLQTISSKGQGDGQNQAPHGVAADPVDGSVYVADMNHASHRIIKFAADGSFVRNIATYVYGVTVPYAYVTHIAVGPNGDVYAVSSHNVPYLFAAILVFDKNGTYKRSITGTGDQPGQLGLIRGIAVDKDSNVYVADASKSLIQKFDSSGAFVRTIGSKGAGPGRFSGDMRGLAVDDANGWLYANDTQASQIEKFTLNGAHLTSFGSKGTGTGQFRDGGRELTVGKDRNVYAPDFGNYRVLVFRPNGTYLRSLPTASPPPPLGGFNQPQGVAVNSATGKVYVADTYNHRIQRFAADGTFERAWGFRGRNDPYALNYPRGVAVDAAGGDVWVANTREGNVKRFSGAGTFRSTFGSWGSGTGQYNLERDLTVAGNRVYHADSNNRRVVVTTKSGSTIWSQPCGTPAVPNQGTGLLMGCTGIAVDGQGNVYAAAVTEHVIYKFAPDGTLLTKYGTQGSGDGQLRQPYDVAFRDGRLYVSESGNNRVSVFDTSFAFLGKFGTPGDGDGQLRVPKALDVDAAGTVYVVDSVNERVQVYAHS